MKFSIFLLGMLIYGMYRSPNELHAQPGSGGDVSSNDSTIDSTKNSAVDSVQQKHWWISILVTPYRSFGWERFEAVPAGVGYSEAIGDNIALGGHLKLSKEGGYVEIGPTLTYTYRNPKLSQVFFCFAAVSPSIIAFIEPVTFSGIRLFSEPRSVRLPFEFGMGISIDKYLHLVIGRTWGFTLAGFDRGGVVELRYGILP